MDLPPLYRPAFFDTLRKGYDRRTFLADLSAGALVGVVALPLSLALAIASGVRPEQGLWTAVIAGALISLFGGSKVQIGGPAGAFVGLCAAGVNQFGFAGLALATMMAGAMVIGLGLMRLGTAISFIPTPVVIGFTSGIALILASTQLGSALGIADPTTPMEHLHERLTYLVHNLGNAHLAPMLICTGVIGVILWLRRSHPRLPGGLIAIVVATLAVWLGGCEGSESGQVATIATRFPDLASQGGLPMFSWPSLSWFTPKGIDDPDFHWLTYIASLSNLALAIGLLGAIESLLSAVVADGMSGNRHDANSELIGQGIANLISPLFGCLPASGVIARTSTNVRAGAKTPVAGLVHAGVVLLMLVALAPLVIHVPLAALAGVLLVVCWYMAELRHWPHLLRAGRGDAILLPIAFFGTAFVGLTQAILVGTTLAMFVFVKRMSEATSIEKASPKDVISNEEIPPGVQIYTVRGPFFFGAATLLRDLEPGRERVRFTILRIANVPFIDATAAFGLRELVATCRAQGGELLVADIHTRPLADLERHGVLELIGEDHVFADADSALRWVRSQPAS